MPETPDILPHAPEVELAAVTTATTTVQIPGTAVETQADADAREAVAAEPKADTKRNEHVVEYDQVGVDSRSPDKAYATKSNIVRP